MCYRMPTDPGLMRAVPPQALNQPLLATILEGREGGGQVQGLQLRNKQSMLHVVPRRI